MTLFLCLFTGSQGSGCCLGPLSHGRCSRLCPLHPGHGDPAGGAHRDAGKSDGHLYLLQVPGWQDGGLGTEGSQPCRDGAEHRVEILVPALPGHC